MAHGLQLQAYLRHLQSRHLAASTIEHVQRTMEGFFVWLDGKDIRDVHLRDLQEYRELLSKLRKSNGELMTVEHQNKQIHILVAFFRYLHRQDKILTDPFSDLPPLKTPKRVPRGIITDQQVMTLLQQPNLFNPIGFRDRALLELLYSTGLRRQEVCRLTVYDVDFSERMIRVVQGKGHRDRVVPLGKVAAKYAVEYLKKVRPILLARATSWKIKREPGSTLADCGALFLSKCGNAMRHSYPWKVMNEYRKAAGLSSTVTLHSLRHACAIEMLRGGASIRHVQEMLGHSQIDTTQIYTRLASFDLKKVHARTSPSERRKNIDVPRFEKKAWRDKRNKW